MQNQLKEGGKVATRAEKIARLKSDDSRQQKIARLRASDADAMSHDDIVNQINPEPPMKRKQPPMKSGKKPYDGFQFSEMVGNVPSSAMQLVKDVTDVVAHPVDTYNAMDNLVRGAYSKLAGKNLPQEANVDAVINALAERYGSIDKAMASLERDPVGVLSDGLSLLSSGAGLAAKGASAAKMGKIAKGAETVRDMANAIEPINAATTAAIKVPQKFMNRNKSPVDDMIEALKLSTTLDNRFGTGTRDRIASTLLKGGYTLDRSGIAKLENDLQKAGLDIQAVLDNPAALEKVIDPRVFDAPINELAKSEGTLQKLTADANQATVYGEIEPWRQKMYEAGDPMQSAKEINDIKRDAQSRANYKNTESYADDLASDTNKVIAREAAKQVENVLPEIKIPNQQWGELAEALPPFRQSVGRMTNNQPSSRLMQFLKSGAAYVVGENVAPGYGLLAAGGASFHKGRKKGADLGNQAIKDYAQQATPYGDLFKDRSRTSNVLYGLLQVERNRQAQEELMMEEQRRGLLSR